MIQAKVIEDSISPAGDRLTTVEATMHRFVLAEFNTHRKFSRNSASSRAIPFPKQVERVTTNPAIPVKWAAERPGMQGGDEVRDTDTAEALWLAARSQALLAAQSLAGLGVHKSIVNRLLEPFMWHTVIFSSTEWENFFRQRCSPLAQPEMRAVAEHIRDAYLGSTPKEVGYGQWHLPYIQPEDWEWLGNDRRLEGLGLSDLDILKRISVARCARVSYLTHDGKRDPFVDLGLFGKLVEADPPHASPLEHVATPCEPSSDPDEGWIDGLKYGNFDGWRQFRHIVLGF